MLIGSLLSLTTPCGTPAGISTAWPTSVRDLLISDAELADAAYDVAQLIDLVHELPGVCPWRPRRKTKRGRRGAVKGPETSSQTQLPSGMFVRLPSLSSTTFTRSIARTSLLLPSSI